MSDTEFNSSISHIFVDLAYDGTIRRAPDLSWLFIVLAFVCKAFDHNIIQNILGAMHYLISNGTVIERNFGVFGEIFDARLGHHFRGQRTFDLEPRYAEFEPCRMVSDDALTLTI